MTLGKTKAYSTKEFVRILLDNGYEFNRCKGDHKIFKKGKDSVIINNNINKMVCRRLVKEHNLQLY